MIGGLLCQEAGMSCHHRRFLTRLSHFNFEMGQSIRQPPVSGVGHWHLLWVLALVCGLSAFIVGPFVGNVGLPHFSICTYCGLKLDMFVGPHV